MGLQKNDSLKNLKQDAAEAKKATLTSQSNISKNSSCEFIENEPTRIRNTDVFMKELAVSSNDSQNDARSATNMDPSKGIFGNRFEDHDPHRSGSFFQMNSSVLKKKRGMSEIQLAIARKGRSDSLSEAENDLFA